MQEVRQPCLGRDQRRARLEAHIAQREMWVIIGQIRGVGGNQRKAALGDGTEPVTLAEFGIGDRQTLGIAACKLHGFLDEIDPQHLPLRAMTRKGQRDGAGAGAEIQQLAAGGLGQFQRALHHDLGVRARNQRGR